MNIAQQWISSFFHTAPVFFFFFSFFKTSMSKFGNWMDIINQNLWPLPLSSSENTLTESLRKITQALWDSLSDSAVMTSGNLKANQLYICPILFAPWELGTDIQLPPALLYLVYYVLDCPGWFAPWSIPDVRSCFQVKDEGGLVLHPITDLKQRDETSHTADSYKKTSGHEPKVIFLSFTFLCLLLSFHTLMYLFLASPLSLPPLPPPHSLPSLPPRLSAGLARQTFRYSCLYSPSLTSDFDTAHTVLPQVPLSYQLISGCIIGNKLYACTLRLLGIN